MRNTTFGKNEIHYYKVRNSAQEWFR